MALEDTRLRSGRRRYSTIAAILALSLVIASCSSDSDSEATTTVGGGSDTDYGDMTSAEIAVEEAKQYAGITLDVTWEAGPQAVDPAEFAGPMWTELTGIEINVIEMDVPDLFSSVVADHQAGGSSFDVLSIVPRDLPDLTSGGVIEPLDSYIDKYINPEDLDDYHPLYKNLSEYDGQRWGLFDDGDVLILYYRTDLFEDPDLQAAFEAEAGRPLEVPATWDDLSEVAQFFTDQLGPDMHGWGIWRNSFNDGMFLSAFQSNGGEFFDVDNDMRALINSEAGLKTVNQMIEQNAAAPDEMISWGIFEPLTAYLAGDLAMTVFWPPLGRWAEAYGTDDPMMEFVPDTEVAGVTGYAPLPGGHSLHSGGYTLGVSADSDAKEAAYLFVQWMTSPEISVQRVQLDTALRDPYRLSHFDDEGYGSLWPTADEYLAVLDEVADNALLDLVIPGSFEYITSLDQGLTSVWAGEDPQTALDAIAAEWDRITDQIGVEQARESWETFLKIPGSSIDTTVSALGLD